MNDRYTASKAAFKAACEVIPGGVNSPVRAFRSVGGIPPFIASGQGAHVTDIDGNEYVDYVGSWGPMIIGHAHPDVVEAVCRAMRDGSSFGAPTLRETELAEMVIDMVPSVQRVRFVSSGTEATMHAIRLARGFTNRSLLVKFEGCYHGAHDAVLASAGSGMLTFGLPGSPGVPEETTRQTIVARHNDFAHVEDIFKSSGDKIAAVIVEPVSGNVGVIPPKPGFLEGLRALCDRYGAVLIFDEVMTGFRVAPGGAQQRFNVTPDITTMGKIIGGGLPVGAFGGRRDIMEKLAPIGDVYQAGTLSGNPLAMAAGLATLTRLRKPGVYDTLETSAVRLQSGLESALRDAGLAFCSRRVGSMMSVFFTGGAVDDYTGAMRSDTARYAAFFHAMLDHGVYLAPSQFEAAFVSLAHSDDDIDRTIDAARDAAEACAAG